MVGPIFEVGRVPVRLALAAVGVIPITRTTAGPSVVPIQTVTDVVPGVVTVREVGTPGIGIVNVSE